VKRWIDRILRFFRDKLEPEKTAEAASRYSGRIITLGITQFSYGSRPGKRKQAHMGGAQGASRGPHIGR